MAAPNVYYPGWNTQQGQATPNTYAPGNPGPHDARSGFLKAGEPGGIDPIIQGEYIANTQVKGSPPPPLGNPYGDVQANAISPVHKHGWTSQGH